MNLANTPVVLSLQEICLTLKNVQILHDVSFELKAHSVTVLYGANGAGKSSLLKLIAGLQTVRDVSGKITFSDSSKGHLTAYMPQQGGLYEELSVLENLRFRAAMLALGQGTRELEALVIQHDLASVLNQPLRQLSGGWKQRVAFALTMMTQARVLLLDEPTAGVDLEAQARIWQQIEQAKQAGACIFISTHNTEEAACADNLLSLHQGRLNYIGTPQDCCKRLRLRQWLFPFKATDTSVLTALMVALRALPNVIFVDYQDAALRVVGRNSELSEMAPLVRACINRFYKCESQGAECEAFFQDGLRALLTIDYLGGV